MKVINWNISYMNAAEPKIAYLDSIVEGNPFIAILQEMTPEQYSMFRKRYPNIRYSLDYRIPGKYDTRQRKLGIAIVASSDFHIEDARVLDRCLLPDRTLLVDLKSEDGLLLRIMGLHSITGIDHKKAKSIQFLSFAEAIDLYRPDIVAFDANEPKQDHFLVDKMVFFDNKDGGEGAHTFFRTLNDIGLSDTYLAHYDTKNYVPGEPLTMSHLIQLGDQKRRYDFVFARDTLRIADSEYHYKDSVKAGSDHALNVVTIDE